MTPPTEGAPSAPERMWIERDGGDLDCCWTGAPTTTDRVEYIRADAALDAIAGMLEEGGFYAASKYLRQRREL